MNSYVRFGLLAAMIVAAAVPSRAGAETCETIFGHVAFNGFTIEPESPRVGDEVMVHFDIVPAVYSVVAFDLLDAGESFEGPTSNATNADFHLTAVQAGLAHLSLRVDYWTEVLCIGDGAPYSWPGSRLTVDSPSYEVSIAPNPEYTPSTPTPTPPPAPTTTANRIPPEAVATARPNPAPSGELVVLDASQSVGPITQATWEQWDPEGPQVDLADCTPSGPCTEQWSVYFIAPSVTSETTLHFSVGLHSIGGTAGASANVEVVIVPAPIVSATPTPTPPPAPTTTANRIPPEAVATARPNPAPSGQLVVLDASQSVGPITQATWEQWDPEGPQVDLADCTPSGPCTEQWSVYFIAPSVTSETTLHFSVGLHSIGGTAGASANIEVVIVPAPIVSATPTPTMTPTASPTPPPCISGCNPNASLSLGDLLSSIEIALGQAPSSECPALDLDQNQIVTVDELIVGVVSLRAECE